MSLAAGNNFDDLTTGDLYAVYAQRPQNSAYTGLPVIGGQNYNGGYPEEQPYTYIN